MVMKHPTLGVEARTLELEWPTEWVHPHPTIPHPGITSWRNGLHPFFRVCVCAHAPPVAWGFRLISSPCNMKRCCLALMASHTACEPSNARQGAHWVSHVDWSKEHCYPSLAVNQHLLPCGVREHKQKGIAWRSGVVGIAHLLWIVIFAVDPQVF